MPTSEYLFLQTINRTKIHRTNERLLYVALYSYKKQGLITGGIITGLVHYDMLYARSQNRSRRFETLYLVGDGVITKNIRYARGGTT